MNDMNYFDIIVLALISILGLKGLFKGFIKELFSLIGIIGGVFVAFRLSNTVGDMIKEPLALSNENTISAIGFIITLVGFWTLAYFSGKLVSKVFQMSGLGIFDRFLGLLFGIGKVFLLFSIIIILFSKFDSIKHKLDNATKNSFMYPILQETGNYIIKFDTKQMKSSITNELNSTINSTKQMMNQIGKDMIKDEINKKLNNTKEDDEK